ncbi:MAG: DegV family protein, partial [Clostridia bacterium]|nr:DegV family protein [Clostridia bacterium]
KKGVGHKYGYEKMREAGRPRKHLVVSHCNCPERALDVKKMIQEACPDIRDITILPTGGVSTFYAFDGGIVVAY